MNIGYPDLLSFTRRNRTTSVIKARIDVASKEAVTGRRSDLTKATNGQVGSAHLLQKALNDIDQSSRMNTLSKTRLDLIGQGISGARGFMGGIDTRGLIALESGSAAGLEVIAAEARESIKNVMGSLGAKQGTRYLMSGDGADKPPFADTDILLADVQNILETATDHATADAALDAYFNDPDGGFEARIYTGGIDPAPPLQIGGGQTVDFDLRANNEAFKEALRGLAVMATTQSAGYEIGTEDFADIFGGGLGAAATGTSKMITLESTLGIHAETIQKADNQAQAEQLSLSAAFQSIVGRDQFEAAAELKQLEVQLESSYIITARLSDLTLTNYLR